MLSSSISVASESELMVVGVISVNTEASCLRVVPQWQQTFAPSGHSIRQASHCVPSIRVPHALHTSAPAGMVLRQAWHCFVAASFCG